MVLGLLLIDRSKAAHADTTDAGKHTGTVSREQLPSDDIVEINIAGGD